MWKGILEKVIITSVVGLVVLIPALYGTWQAASSHVKGSGGEPTVVSMAERVEFLESEHQAHFVEIQSMKQLLLTRVGTCEIYNGSDALVNRRSPYRRGTRVSVTNI